VIVASRPPFFVVVCHVLMRQTHSKQRNGQEPNLQKVLAIKTLNLRDAA